MKYIQLFLASGIPLNKNNGIIRNFVQGISELPLDSIDNIKSAYLEKLLKIKKENQIADLHGKRVTIIADATPRMVDVFALIVRFLSTKDHKVSVDQRLVSVNFIQGLLNAATQCGVVQKGLQSVRLIHEDVVSAPMDGCSTNELFVKMIREYLDVEWMLNNCFSICGNSGSVLEPVAEYLLPIREYKDHQSGLEVVLRQPVVEKV
jgi:hypothetical protein